MRQTATYKIDTKTARKIQELAAQGVDTSALSERYGVTMNTITRIVADKRLMDQDNK